MKKRILPGLQAIKSVSLSRLMGGRFFLDEIGELQLDKTSFSPTALGALNKYDWPGNMPSHLAWSSKKARDRYKLTPVNEK